MKDQCNRNIEYIRISITDRCNLRCQYCMPESGVEWISHDAILSYEEIIHIASLLHTVGITKVRITGGEPLVRKNVSFLIKQLKEQAGVTHISLTTNALLLTEQLDELVEAGLDSINVSLDTIDANHFKILTRGGDVNLVKQAITKTKEYPNIEVKLNCVAYAQSEQEIIDMIHFAKEMDVAIRFIELMPIGLGKQFTGKSQEELIHMIEKLIGITVNYDKRLGNGPAQYIRIQKTQQIVGFISAISHKFCEQCNRIRLTADGHLKACLQYQDGVDVKYLLREKKTDAQILDSMQKVIFTKPKEHHFLGNTTETDEVLDMSKIGG